MYIAVVVCYARLLGTFIIFFLSVYECFIAAFHMTLYMEVSDIDGMVGWMDGVLNTRAIRRGVTVLPAWQDCVWCVDVVMGH